MNVPLGENFLSSSATRHRDGAIFFLIFLASLASLEKVSSWRIHHRISMENWISLQAAAPPPIFGWPRPTLDSSMKSWWSHTTPGNKLRSVDWRKNEPNSVATGITSDLAAECDLKPFLRQKLLFTVFPSSCSAPPTGGFSGRNFSNLIFTACFTACYFSSFLSPSSFPIASEMVREKFACGVCAIALSALPLCIVGIVWKCLKINSVSCLPSSSSEKMAFKTLSRVAVKIISWHFKRTTRISTKAGSVSCCCCDKKNNGKVWENLLAQLGVKVLEFDFTVETDS